MLAGKTYWERHAKRYDRSTRFLAGPVPRMLDLAVAAARGLNDVLEVAAGTGLLTVAIAPVVTSVIATDYAPAMVAQLEARLRAEKIGNVVCRKADIYALPFPDRAFDAVVAANVLHLVPDLEQALASLRRVLRPNGHLIAPTYLHAENLGASLLSRLLGLTGFPGARRLSSSTLREAVEAAGFRVATFETIRGPFPVGFVDAIAI
jgi:phosphatidylethanolamine/phosphatidyl-N-methylethanolamine N-methyltransferase